jgi:hypothetical protein
MKTNTTKETTNTFYFNATYEAPAGLDNFDVHHERLDCKGLGYLAGGGGFFFGSRETFLNWVRKTGHTGAIDEEMTPYGGFIASVVKESISFNLDEAAAARLRALLEQDFRFSLPLRFTPRGEFTLVDSAFALQHVTSESLREVVRRAHVGYIGRLPNGRVLSFYDGENVVYGTAAALESSWIFNVVKEQDGAIALEPVTYGSYTQLYCPRCDTTSLYRLQDITSYAHWADELEKMEDAGLM